MTTKYLLPCGCGEELPIDIGQAGQNIVCKCGRTIEAPTLRGIRQLTPAPVSDESKGARGGAAWRPGQGVAFALGVLTTVVALAVGAERFYRRAALDTVDRFPDSGAMVDERIDGMPVDELWDFWIRILRDGLGAQETPQHVLARRRYDELTTHIFLLLIAAALGACLIVGSVVWKPRRTQSSSAG
jgi:hypothetical protein